ncbi:hypothetical protein A5731_07880 [Mycolicibacterium conceptionense]|uniref:DUF5642 domain-containing protein n=1 Tax=Mycolicibacterium conceptionense TaxID=451644 RepID=A0A1A1ZW68_9MYCO|nr:MULTISPECIES: hypothetical protein [Mycolicibacterium]MCW1821961.1 hypothetical protein [Mycolicibacterium senegalense]OBB14095.1 hypothetical protein A5718_01720 [Mycolicibacterium conceptionense]OBF07345.1 hypothetical protein A5731_07880 [Mycolicibacterium conceptionense]OBF14587.1 hypothetical protein A5726_24165 [Mycolicibacterium conceptionense]OBF47783.1 hypothetical protein A5720_04710 [Mycolicibacterium conceptionense]
MLRCHRWVATSVGLVALLALSGCAPVISGTPTWPGATLDKVLLTPADFPPGVQVDRVIDDGAGPGGSGGPPPMLSIPAGCSDGLTRVIAESVERGPGSAAQIIAAYDGARIVLTVTASPLPLDKLAATAQRCAQFSTYFDPADKGIPMTTTKLDVPRASALAYQQTMQLGGQEQSIFFAFENLGSWAVFGIAFPTQDPSIAAKGALPQTFLDVFGAQAERVSTR